MALPNRGAGPASLARALYPSPDDESLSMSDVVGITADLTATEGLVARDAVIADLQTQVANLTAALTAKDAQIAALTASAVAAGTVTSDAPVPEGTPTEIKMLSPYGYIDTDGRSRNWTAGTVIKDRQEIAMLVARKADHQVLQGPPPASCEQRVSDTTS